MFKSLTGYRTLIVQAILAVVGLLVAFGAISAADAAGVTQETVAQNVDTVIGAVMILGALVSSVMRLVTKGPVPPVAK